MSAAALGLAVWLGMIAVRDAADLTAVRDAADLTAVSPLQFAAQCLNLVLFTLVFAALAVCVGAATGRKDAVVAVTATAGVAAYAAHTFGAKLGVAWTQWFSPFHYYLAGDPLRHGFRWLDATILTATALTFVALGVHRFDRRDLGR
ncbi:hypothetical protein D7D52_20780 [Nocardia yunnanensis]|uniref:ABC transporter permease n=1 Tax=Nocardia yunnanensis TaxID=2382165 RepID=A0A386ZH31_9NOCA|nr:hypothetical protein [Nocardia yunnanensis]AYF75869.1 hypothetical protein D7D52_20780 [Nocardia yunnanensis]